VGILNKKPNSLFFIAIPREANIAEDNKLNSKIPVHKEVINIGYCKLDNIIIEILLSNIKLVLIN
jgi:hypothetical protein